MKSCNFFMQSSTSYYHRVLSGSMLRGPKAKFHTELNMVLTNIERTCGQKPKIFQRLFCCVKPNITLQYEHLQEFLGHYIINYRDKYSSCSTLQNPKGYLVLCYFYVAVWCV